ncbi:creatininase family protein, partial [Patulibacter sp. S7RM1-6]
MLVPCGAVEQHGPHLPVGVDAWLAQAVALDAAGRADDVLVAEPLAYGVSGHHAGFAGTATLRPATFVALARDVCASLWRDGLLPVLVNAHGGNRAALDVALAELGAEGVRAGALSYFDLIAADLPELPPSAVGHACALETSLLLHLWPNAVDAGAIPAGGTPDGWPDPHLWSGGGPSLWRPFEELNPTGVVGEPSRASAELGARIRAAAAAR